MSQFRPSHRKDGNHAAIEAALRQAGWKTQSLSDVGKGCPDILAWHPQRGWRLVEVKQGKGSLTRDQQQFIQQGWPVVVVRTVQEAAQL